MRVARHAGIANAAAAARPSTPSTLKYVHDQQDRDHTVL